MTTLTRYDETTQLVYLLSKRILFPKCPAIWRAKSWHFGGTKSVKTARWRAVCATSCHLSRISYEPFMKCVTSNVTHVHETDSWTTSRDTLETIFKHFKISPRHGTQYFTWPALPRIPTHSVSISYLNGTPNCVPRRKPFVVPVWGLPYPSLTLYGHTKTTEQLTIIHQYGDWYTGRCWVGCYIWYGEEGPGRTAASPSPLLAVPNVIAHPSMASVST